MQITETFDSSHLSARTVFYGVVLALLIGVGGWVFAMHEAEALGWMQQNREWLQGYMAEHPLWGAVAFTLVFGLVLGFYIPGGIVLMLLVGAIFPFWTANVVANLGNLLGATIGFLLSRHLLRDEVQCCYGHRLTRVNKGIKRNGWLYLIVLRIAPVLPSPVVNLLMGLTPMPPVTYVWATLLGRIPMTALYVNIGAELGGIESLSDLLSIELIVSLVLVAALMVAGHFALTRCEEEPA